MNKINVTKSGLQKVIEIIMDSEIGCAFCKGGKDCLSIDTCEKGLENWIKPLIKNDTIKIKDAEEIIKTVKEYTPSCSRCGIKDLCDKDVGYEKCLDLWRKTIIETLQS